MKPSSDVPARYLFLFDKNLWLRGHSKETHGDVRTSSRMRVQQREPRGRDRVVGTTDTTAIILEDKEKKKNFTTAIK